MFESPNYVSKYRSGQDATEDYWKDFKKVISKADLKIAPSGTSLRYLKEWVGDNKDNYAVINPCINDLLMHEWAENTKKPRKKYDLVMTARLTTFKNPHPIFRLLDKKLDKKIKVALIGKNVTGLKFGGYKNIEIDDLGIVDDEKKFMTLAQSKAMIFPSKFEGFGMPPGEALYFDKPVLAYDIPVLREVYGDSLIFAKSKAEFVDNILKTLNTKKITVDKSRVVTSKKCKEQMLDVLPIKKWPKVSAGIIVYNGMDYLKYAIEGIYDDVDEIIVVEGAVKGFSKKAHSTDGTYEYLSEVDTFDPQGKIRVVFKAEGLWESKVQMQNEIAKRVTGDIYIKVDSDEIWEPGAIKSICDYMKENPDVSIIRMPFVHLWTAFNIQAVDNNGKWSTKHPRVWRWKKSFKHNKSFNYFVDTSNDNVHVKEPRFKEHVWEDHSIFHFGYVKTLAQVDEKLKYYKTRGIENNVDVNCYKNWVGGDDPTQPTQKSSGSKGIKISRKLLPPVMRIHQYYKKQDVRKAK